MPNKPGHISQHVPVIGASWEAGAEPGPQCLWCDSLSLHSLSLRVSAWCKNSPAGRLESSSAQLKTARHVNVVHCYQQPLSLQHLGDGAGQELQPRYMPMFEYTIHYGTREARNWNPKTHPSAFICHWQLPSATGTCIWQALLVIMDVQVMLQYMDTWVGPWSHGEEAETHD